MRTTLSISFLVAILLTNVKAYSQFENVFQAEAFFRGTWAFQDGPSDNSDGSDLANSILKGLIHAQMNRDQSDQRLTFRRDHTYTFQLGHLYQNQVISGNWEVDFDGQHYFVRAYQNGLFRIERNYYFDGSDHLVDQFGTVYRRY